MVEIEIRCPVCSELQRQEFDDDYLDDPAFTECMDDQPWCVPCYECQEAIRRQFSNNNKFADFLFSCQEEDFPALDMAREFIQQVNQEVDNG